MADMAKAGLNPILASQQGGASQPQGATATMQNKVEGAASTARAIASDLANIRLVEAQAKNIEAGLPKKNWFAEQWTKLDKLTKSTAKEISRLNNRTSTVDAKNKKNNGINYLNKQPNKKGYYGQGN
jgi:hypothetical protein